MIENPFNSSDYTEKSLQDIWSIVSQIAKEDFQLDFYEPQFELCTFEEMLQIYTTSFPIMFNHWSFGKAYEDLYRQYKHNRAAIAYEVIFNTNPALCYLLETNTSVMQGIVMAHAAIGHSSFFKNNEFLLENTNAKTAISMFKNMRQYVSECELKYGTARVSELLDVCMSLQMYAIDRADKLDITREQQLKKKQGREKELEKDFDLIAAEISKEADTGEIGAPQRLKEDNILKFIAKHSPSLRQWERELVLKYCDIRQYFYPQYCTKLMNEGFASFWHYEIMNKLYDKNYLKDGDVLEFLCSHTGVTRQTDWDDPHGYRGINPYSLGLAIFQEIKRICLDPTEEDKYYCPYLIGRDWVEEVKFAAYNFKDESFILQYLTPKIVRDFKLFKFEDDTSADYWEVKATQEDKYFYEVRKQLAESYNLFKNLPIMYVEGADLRRNRTLYLVIEQVADKQLDTIQGVKVAELLKKIWPYPVKFKYKLLDGNTIAETF